MAKIKLTFTDEHIALIKALNFSQIDVNEIIKSFEQYNKEVLIINDPDKFYENIKDIQTKIINKETTPSMINPIKSGVEEISIGEILYRNHIDIDNIYGIDNFNLWGGTYLYEQMAYILGISDRVIPETLEDPMGPRYPDEDMEHMKDLDCWFINNLSNIMEILIQFCTEGIQPNVTYWCYDYQHIWYKEI